jgi:hypothetical protein
MSLRAAAMIVAAIVLLLLTASSSARTWYITPDGTGDAPTIQAGIDSAQVGDDILLLDGVFTGPGNRGLDFHGKAVELGSLSGDFTTCIIDCESADYGFFMENGEETRNTIVSGVTVRNAGRTGIWCYNASPSIVRCRIESNGGTTAPAGIHLVRSSALVKSCLIRWNVTVGDVSWLGNGGGVKAFSCQDLEIVDCEITENSANEGGGIYLWRNNDSLIEGCLISDNFCSGAGSGIRVVLDTTATVRDCEIRGNSGGVAIESRFHSLSMRIEGTSITNNDGGGLHIGTQDNFYVIEGCTIVNNAGGFSAGVRVLGNEATMTNSIVHGNCLGQDADQIFVAENRELSVFCSIVDLDGVVNSGTLDLIDVFDVDPLFCDPVPCTSSPTSNGDYSLHEHSPALPDGNECGVLIGALGQGCGPVSVEPETWAGIKARYR